MLTIEARAKVNLTLDILGKRTDGYHEVEMVMQSLDLSDSLTFRRQEAGITLLSNVPGLPEDARNLVYQAAELLKRRFGVQEGIFIEITKRIPIAAGLGGGSSDAAAALVGLNEYWNLGLKPDVLCALGARIGSDVPFCIEGGTMLARGRGEILERLAPLPSCHIVLAKPQASVSTAWVYQKYRPEKVGSHPDTKGIMHCLQRGDLAGVCARLSNVLESVTVEKYEEIAALKKRMRDLGAEASLMSGSGPTVFAVTPDEERAAYIARKMSDDLSRVQIILTRSAAGR